MRMMSENWIVLGAVLALTAGATAMVYYPQHKKLSQCQVQIEQQHQAMREDVSKASVVPSMVRQVQDMRSRHKNLDRRLPQQKELASFLGEITSQVSQERLANQVIMPGSKPLCEDEYNTLPIEMKFQGTFLSLVSFLKRIDRMERLTRVQRLRISADPKNKDLGIELQLNIYFTASDALDAPRRG